MPSWRRFRRHAAPWSRTETGDGATLTGRPELQTILDFIHPGETLVVTRIDRLARSMRDLQLIVATLKDKGAHLAATELPVDTSTAAGKAFFDMLGASSPSSRPTCAVSARPRGSPRRSNAASIAAAHPGSTCKPSSIGWPGACRRRKSPASWGSHAEPSTRPGQGRPDGEDCLVPPFRRCEPGRRDAFQDRGM